jgi:hypothetical protein
MSISSGVAITREKARELLKACLSKKQERSMDNVIDDMDDFDLIMTLNETIELYDYYITED